MEPVAEFNLHNNQLIFYPHRKLSKEEWERFTRQLRMSWGRGRKCFYGVWAPEREDAILEYVDTVEVIIDDDAGYTDRLGRFDRYTTKAGQRAAQRFRAAAALVEGIPMGQPILIGHHSEKRHRAALERHDRHMCQGIEEQRKKEHWAARVKAVEAHRERLERPQTIFNRIKKYEKALANWTQRGESPERERWLDHLRKLIDYQKALYAESGMLPVDTGELTLEVGGAVRNPHYPAVWVPIWKVNAASVTVLTAFNDWDQPFTETVVKSKILEALSQADYKNHLDWSQVGQRLWSAYEAKTKKKGIKKGDAIRYQYVTRGDGQWLGPVEVVRDGPKNITVLKRFDRHDPLRLHKLEKWLLRIERVPAAEWRPERDRQELQIELERLYISHGWQESGAKKIGPEHEAWAAVQALAGQGVVEEGGGRHCWILAASIRQSLIEEKFLYRCYEATGVNAGHWLDGLSGEPLQHRINQSKTEVNRVKQADG